MNLPSVVNTRVFHKTVGGNPCPVVRNADSLSSEKMRMMAKNFGLESVFILKPTHKEADFHFRYFVPHYEMEMCVHATIAAVKTLVIYENITQQHLKIETKLGVIPINWWHQRGDIIVEVTQFLPKFYSKIPPISDILKALHIKELDIDFSVGPIQSVSTSRAKLMIPLKNYIVLNQLKPNYEFLWELCDQYDVTGFYPFTIHTREQSIDAEARQFPKRVGYNEDSATGLAACALGAYFVEHQVFDPSTNNGVREFQVEQGVAMNMPSLIKVRIELNNQQISKAIIQGSAAID